jgi:predicted secreted Zn-dependent protease
LSYTSGRGRAASFALGVIFVVGCGQTAVPTGTPSTPATTATAAQSAAPSSPAGSAAPSSPAPSASPVAELLPIAGTWRVRKVLSQEDRTGLISDRTFDEETYSIAVGCETEPCDTIELTTTPLGLASPAKTTKLTRDGAFYSSGNEAPETIDCRTVDGDRVAGGATAKNTLRLWIATDRPAGTSVKLTVLRGDIELVITPTSVGESAGCEGQTASFELSGRREEVAVRDPNGPTQLDLKPPPNATFVRLPRLTARIANATIRYFGITGDTSPELAMSVARGGATACGVIDYEWFRGDARPSACTITYMTDIEESIRTSIDSSGTCRITAARFQSRYVVNLPRWTAPARVPKRLLDWWRRIVDFIAVHEGGHVKIGRDYIKKLNARLTGKDCAQAEEVIGAWAKQHAAAQEAFDRAEYQKPWPRPAAGY